MNRCPVCREQSCTDAVHAAVREEIRADRELDLRIEAGDE